MVNYMQLKKVIEILHNFGDLYSVFSSQEIAEIMIVMFVSFECTRR